MSYKATVFKVMIASPSDVVTERNIIREVLAEWNAVNSERQNIVLLPIGWETHSSPEMGDRPQAIINKQILKDCDLLVGIFWTRIGTETGKYPSGTVEEIEEHIKTGKPTMLYFSSTPVSPDRVDIVQYSELNKFKISCKSRGLLETYSSKDEFKSKFYQQLQLKLNSDKYFTDVSELPSGTQFVATSPLLGMPTLSHEAQILLKEASQDSNGDIVRMLTFGGLEVQSNEKILVQDNNPKQQAIWEGAIEELENQHFIKDRGYEREIFRVTKEGYQIAELIKEQEAVAVSPDFEEAVWEGIQLAGQFYAWTGPLLALEDRDPILPPASLLEEIEGRGLTPKWANSNKLGYHVGQGLSQVFATDQKTWRRAVTDRGRFLMVGNPPANQGAVVPGSSHANPLK